jgi:threonine dehydratase
LAQIAFIIEVLRRNAIVGSAEIVDSNRTERVVLSRVVVWTRDRGKGGVIDLRQEALEAERRIRPYVRETYVERSGFYSQLADADVWLKLENLQHTGSFKVRGAMNKLLSLTAEQRAAGVVAASSGNHGAGLAHCARHLEVPGVVFVPRNALPGKGEAIARLGGQVRVHGHEPAEAELHARRYAEERGLIYVSPYNDSLVMGGQGTVGVELDRQLDSFDAVFVAVGGGGLVSGLAGYLKAVRPGVRIVGCSPRNSQVMIRSVKEGRIVDAPSLATLSDGTAGGLEPGALTLQPCRELVDEFVTVTEEEIGESLRTFIRSHHLLIEGAAAVALAAFVKTRTRYAGLRVVIVLCGANISPEILKTVL